MPNKHTINLCTLLTTALTLSSVIFSCKTLHGEVYNSQSDKELSEKVDTFRPTHPPIVIPHSWRQSQGKIEY